MNFLIKGNDSVLGLIKKRIAFFKDLHERYADEKTRGLCQLKINTLEMVLNDIHMLESLRSDKF